MSSRRDRAPSLQLLTRHEVARHLGIHADTCTARMRDGLASAVVTWGGRGKLMMFSQFHVDRWAAAFRCQRANGRPCWVCWTTLEDTRFTAEHLIEARHGINGCPDCTSPWLTTIPHEETQRC